MLETIYASFGSNGFITVRSILYFFLVALVVGFFGVFVVRAIKERFSSKPKEKPDSERTTETVTIDLD